MTIGREVFRISEQKVAGRSFISSDEVPGIRIGFTEPEEGVREYSVTGFVPLERQAIGDLLQSPIGGESYSWEDVRDGLRAISYPSRKITLMSRSAIHARQLGEVKAVSRELADIMSNNQDYTVKTGNMPVFNYSEAQQYAADILYSQTSERKLLLMLKSVGLDSVQAKRYQSIISSATQTPEGIKQLELITGMDLSDQTSAQVEALLGDVDTRYVTELIHRLQYDLFIGFPEQSRLIDGKLVGGSHDLTVLLRESDIPVALPVDFTNVSVDAPRVGVKIGSVLRDTDRKTGLKRRRVTFYTQADRQVALARVAWQTRGDERTFAFPVSPFEHHANEIARPSSLLGAALMAQTIGHEAGIDYEKALRKRMRYLSTRIGRAGLWPLVATHHQEEILSHPYFEAIEKQLQ